MFNDLPIFEVSIDPEHSENNTDLGIDLISNVKDPAVKIKGFAFKSNLITKEMRFTDSTKYRIAAPVMVPGDIYRNDDAEYYIRFTNEKIEQLAKKFMKQLSRREKGVFNYEHSEEIFNESDTYILEVIIVDSKEKQKMVNVDYNIDVPLGTFFIVQQFDNVELYERLVKEEATGFSLEGFLGMETIEELNNKNEKKMNKNSKLSKMTKKTKFVGKKRTFKSASKKKRFEEVLENEELIIVADELAEGSEVVVVEDVTAGPIEDFSGEVEVVSEEGSVEVLIIEGGVITEVVSEEATEEVSTELETEEKKEEVTMETEVKEEEEVVLEEEVKEEELEVVEETPVSSEGDLKTEIESIYKMIGELKAEISELKGGASVSESTEETQLKSQKFTNSLISYLNKIKEQ